MEPDDLLAAVNAVSRPIVENIPIEDDDGNYVRTHTVQHPCLIDQLEESIYGSPQGGGGGSSSSSERNIVDPDALFEFTKIQAAIGDWCRIAGFRWSKVAAVDLPRWYVAHTAKPAHTDDWHARELRRWAHQIKSRLDAPRRREVTDPCPACGATEYLDSDGNTMRNPVILEFRPSDGENLENATATCRNKECGQEWSGERELRDLRFQIGDPYVILDDAPPES